MSRSRICIVDYGVGNLQSIRNAVRSSTKQELDLVGHPEDLTHYEKIVLPGVGAFGDAMTVLKKRALDVALLEEFKKGKPLLGICLGMQVLAEKGFEHGEHQGLGLIPASVEKIEGSNIHRIHMGWNDLELVKDDPLLAGIPSGTDFYFVHGYSMQAKSMDCVLATCEYGKKFAAIVRKENAWGVQFHPEKSQQQGVNILKNFVEM